MPLLKRAEPPRTGIEELDEYLLEVHGLLTGIGPDTQGTIDKENIGIPIADTSATETISGKWHFEAHPTGLKHGQIDDIGIKTHADIDTHITDTTQDDHTQYLNVARHDADDHSGLLPLSHINPDHLTDVGTNTHAQIDNHIADTSIHTPGVADHKELSNIGFLSHDDAEINTLLIAERNTTPWTFLRNGAIDAFKDESGIDIINSINRSYNATNTLYQPSAGPFWDSAQAVWHMNNDWTDAKGDNDGIGHGGIVFTINSKLGSHAGLFDGIDDYVSQPLDLAKDAGFSKISIEAWVYAEDDGIDEPNFIIEYFDGVGNTRRYIHVRPVSNKIGFALGSSGYLGNFNLWNQWVHIVMTGDGSTIKGYINANYVPLVAGSDNYYDNSGTGWIPDIGRAKSSADRYFKGRIDELIIYNRVLSESEISERYNAGIGKELIPEISNMTLISKPITAEIQPDKIKLILFEEDVDTITLNTDLKVYSSRDGGTTYTQGTLIDKGNYESGKRILQSVIDVSGQPAGTSVKYKIETLNNKNLKLHGIGQLWR